MKSNWTILLAVPLVLVLFVALNMAASRTLSGARIDATQARLYTLTEGSRNIARSLQEPITLRFFFSSSLARGKPVYQTHAQRVRETLTEYARLSRGNIRIEFIDPRPFTEDEDRAQAAGLSGLPVGPSGEVMYMGLVGTNSLDATEIIQFFDPERENFLEYDISRIIGNLARPAKKTIGLLSSLPIQGGFSIDPSTRQPRQQQPWVIANEIGALFTFETLQPSITAIPDTVDVLMVVHPRNLPDAALYAIDQFALRGGKILAFVDPFCEAEAASGGFVPPAQRASTLGPLLEAWGVAFDPSFVVADAELALRVRTPGPNNREEIQPFVVWLSLTDKQIARDDPATGRLSRITLAGAGALSRRTAKDGAPSPAVPTANFTPLFTSAPKSMALPTDRMGPVPDPKTLLAAYAADDVQRTLAARITGRCRSAFPDGPPKTGAPGDGSAPTHLAESAAPLNVVLIADADMLYDSFWVERSMLFGTVQALRKLADNGDFVVNALDNLSGSSDLISIRARRTASRPFDVVEKMRRDAESRFLAEQTLLERELQDAESRIADLRSANPVDGRNGLVLTPEVRKEIETFQKRAADARKRLREIQAGLRSDIEALGRQLKLINIALVPGLVAFGALCLAAVRAIGRRRTLKEAPR